MTINSVLRQMPRVFAAVALATSVAGCYSLSRVPARYIANERPAQVFVRDAEGSIYALSNPTIVKDSLVGQDGDDQLSVNLREVDAMAVRAISPTRTAGAIAATLGVAGMLTFGVIKATGSKDCPRIANRNNQCVYDVQTGCKYSACNDGNDYNDYPDTP